MSVTSWQEIEAEPGSSVYAVLHGDVHVRDGRPVYRVAPAARDRQPVDADEALRRPSSLLLPQNRVVDFDGRRAELDRLCAWRDDPAPGISLMLLHGPGGQGKTRLAAEFTDRSVGQGWTGWEAHHVSSPTGHDVVAPGDSGARLLLVVDYAERWPVDDLLLLLRNPLLTRPAHTRVLLVSRPARTWWPALAGRLPARLSAAEPLRLGAMADGPVARRSAYDSAYGAFAPLFRLTRHDSGRRPDLDDQRFELVLNIHMAALVAADARARGRTAPTDPPALSSYLLDREHDFWTSLHEHEAVTTGPATMARTVHTATLTRALPPAQAAEALVRAGTTTPEHSETVLRDHAVAYPPLAEHGGLLLEPLYPDRLGEDLLALRTPGHGHADYEPDPWAQGLPRRLLTPPTPEPTTPAGHVRPSLTTLVETARRWPHVAERELAPLLRHSPHLALVAGGNTLAAIAELDGVGIDVLEAVERRLPARRDIDLDAGIAVLARRLTAHRLRSVEDPARQAVLHHDLAVRLARAGRYEEAVAEGETAVRLQQPSAVAADRPARAQLGRSLRNLGMHLARLERLPEALAAVEQAAETHERLHREEPDAYAAELAVSTHDHSVLLMRVGRLPEALAAAERAVAGHRSGAGGPGPADPRGTEESVDRRDYAARAVSQRGSVLAELGRDEEALTDAHEAVRAYRELAAEVPSAYSALLAAAISNEGMLLLRSGRVREAVTAAEEVVAVFRKLARTNPDAYEDDLARALGNLSVRQAGAGLRTEALAAAEEAVEILRRLVAANPTAFERSYAVALHNLGARLVDHGSWAAALAANRQAETIHRRLARVNPSVHRPDLSAALTNISVALFGLGRAEDAVAVMREALDIDRALAADNPRGHMSTLALSLGHFTVRLGMSGRHEEAVETAREGVDIVRRLAEERPGAYRVSLARSLVNLGIGLARTGRHSEAVAAVAEAVQLYREASAAEPGVHDGALTVALSVHGLRLSESGRHAEALTVTREALERQRQLHRARPDGVDSLVRIVRDFATVRLAAAAETADARAAVDDVMALLTAPAAADTGRGGDHLAVLRRLADQLAADDG